MAGVSSDGKTYTDSNGIVHTFLGAWNPNTIYKAAVASGSSDNAQNSVVEYGGGYYQVAYYNQDVNPLLASEPVNSSQGQPWVTLANPISASVVPQAPGTPTASFLSAGTVSLQWSPSLVLGAGDVSSYQVYESTSSNFANASLVGMSTSPSITINGLSADTTYYYKVVAVDVSGSSQASAKSAAVTTTDMNPDSGKFFSPFVDLTQPSEDIVGDAARAGLRDFTIAFFNSAGLQSPALSSGSTTTSGSSVPTPMDGNYANDGSVPTLSLGGATVEPNGIPVLNNGAILSSVKQVESEGGTVTVSVGGYTGRDPATIAAEYGAYLNGTPFSYSSSSNSGVSTVTTSGGSAPAAGTRAYNTAVANLQAEYQAAVSSTGANAISFDIENDAVPNEQWQYSSGGYWHEVQASGPSAYQMDILGNSALDLAADAMRTHAILGLEKANPNLYVSYTLAVEPTGLADGSNTNTGTGGPGGGVTASDNSEALLLQAKAAGVTINAVNIMAMDYGTASNASGVSYNDYQTGGTAMAQAAEQAATATEAFLVANGMSSTKVEITPMLGQNDTQGEVFTLKDAVALEAWASQQSWVAGLGEWSLNRDHAAPSGSPAPGSSSASASSTNDGLPSQTDFQLSEALAMVANAATVATMNANLSSLNGMTNGFAVGDTEANIVGGLAGLQKEASHIVSIYATDDKPVAVSVAQFKADQAALDKIVGGFTITDSAAAIANNIGAIQGDSNISSINPTNGTVTVAGATAVADKTALNKIVSGFSISLYSSTFDSQIGALAANNGHIDNIYFANGNPVVKLTTAQATADASLIGKVAGSYVEQVSNTNGTTTTTGHGSSLVINAVAGGNDQITGGGASDTFVFQAGFGKNDSITDFATYISGASHDTVSLASSEFANFTAVLNDTTYSSAGATITAPSNGDTLLLKGVTAAMLSKASADFTFHS